VKKERRAERGDSREFQKVSCIHLRAEQYMCVRNYKKLREKSQ
jgi:hypothetical protein